MESVWFWWRYFKPVHREWMEDKRHLEILPAKCTYSFTQVTFVSSGIVCYAHRWIMVSSGGHYAHNRLLMLGFVWIQTHTHTPLCSKYCLMLILSARTWTASPAISSHVQMKLRFIAEIRVASELRGGLSQRSSASRCNLNLSGYKCFFPTCQNPPSSRRHSRPCPDNTLTHTLTHTHTWDRGLICTQFSAGSPRDRRGGSDYVCEPVCVRKHDPSW